MYKEQYENFIHWFWIETDWGIFWLSFVFIYFILSMKYISKSVDLDLGKGNGIWICRACQGTNVSEETWKDINTGEVTDSGLEFYCSDCMSDTKVMLKGEEE